MKRAAMVIAVVAVATWSLAQGYGGQRPATQPSAQPAAQQAQPGQATPPPPQGKRPPQAKSQEEFTAYQKAVANTDPAALEKAADDFAAKFPNSELRILLFKDDMQLYQRANNGDKVIEMGRKALQIDGSDPIALVMVASVLSERTRETDLDKDERLNEAVKDAKAALDNVDTNLTLPPNAPPEQVTLFKNMLRSMAFAALGNVELARNNNSGAETNLRKSIELGGAQPDPVSYLRLAVALDHQNKYPDALVAANKAVELAPEGTTAGNLARRERDRLVQLTGGTPQAAGTAGTPGAAPAGTPSGQAAPTTPPANTQPQPKQTPPQP